MSKSSSDYSDVYEQVGGSCWAYTSSNVVMRFISMVLNTYDLEDRDVFMRKKKTEKPITNLEDFIEYFKENGAKLLDFRQCFYFFICMVAVDSDYYVKLIKKGINIVEYFDTEHADKYDNTHKALHDAQIYKGRHTNKIMQYILNFLKNCKSVNAVKDVFARIVFYGKRQNLDNKLCDDIFEKIKTYNKYVISKKLRPTIVSKSSGDNRVTYLLKKSLNQNMYSALTVNDMNTPLTPEEALCLNNKHDDMHFSDHAMTCVGYLMNTKQLVVKNSWGTEWCEGGVTLWSTLKPKSNPEALLKLTFINSNLPEHKMIPNDFVLFHSGNPIVSLSSRKYADNKNWYDIKKKFASIFNRPSPNHETILDVPHKKNLLRNSPTRTLKKYSYRNKLPTPSSSSSSPPKSPSPKSSPPSPPPKSPPSSSNFRQPSPPLSETILPSPIPVESHDTMMKNFCEKEGKEYIKGTRKKWKCHKKCLENQTRNPKTLRCVKKDI